MTPELSAIKDVLDAQANVSLAYVYGSLARGEARLESDLDIAVQSQGLLDPSARIALVDALALATGRAIDLVDLRLAGEPLLGEILRDGIRLKGSVEDHAQLMVRHIFDTEDFVPYQRRILQERRRAWTS